jgi:hypothetical protein
MPPIMSSRGHLRARKIWIDDALGGAARCRLVALRQRGIGAFDVARLFAESVQANRIVRIIRLGPSCEPETGNVDPNTADHVFRSQMQLVKSDVAGDADCDRQHGARGPDAPAGVAGG